MGLSRGRGLYLGGIALIQDYELVVDGENIVKELNGYVWSDKKSNTPIDASNHILDALRYVVMHQHFNNFDYAIC